MNPLLLQYVKSFSAGRVRIRHPALKRESVIATVRDNLSTMPGINSLEFNSLSGSVLILYDSEKIGQQKLLATGAAWAEYLDSVQAGQPLPVPETR